MPKVHLTGDRIISSATLDYLEAMREEWQIPGVSLAIVRMDKDGKWEKQTIGLGRKDSEGNQVTDRVSCQTSCSTLSSIRAGWQRTDRTKSLLPDLVQHCIQLETLYRHFCRSRPVSMQLYLADTRTRSHPVVPVDEQGGRVRDHVHRAVKPPDWAAQAWTFVRVSARALRYMKATSVNL
jgi:hypothetical protein